MSDTCCEYAAYMKDPFVWTGNQPSQLAKCDNCLRTQELWEASYEEQSRREQERLSPVLQKACMDSFDYRLCLTDGSTIRFSDATLHKNGEWLSLTGISEYDGPLKSVVLERGLDVSVNAIVWAVDAPAGS